MQGVGDSALAWCHTVGRLGWLVGWLGCWVVARLEDHNQQQGYENSRLMWLDVRRFMLVQHSIGESRRSLWSELQLRLFDSCYDEPVVASQCYLSTDCELFK